MNTQGLFRIERQGKVFWVAPTTDLSELLYPKLMEASAAIFKLLDEGEAIHVVLDLELCDYCGSSALALFLKLWKWVRENERQMALCHVSEHTREILRITKLDQVWPLCDSLQDAIDFVQRDEPS